MDKLLFGISGLPLEKNTIKFNYSSAINYLKALGLDAMELPFVRSINVTSKNKESILNSKNSADFHLSAHGSYYINLNAHEDEKINKSLERITNGAMALNTVQGKDLVFHPGYYLGDDPQKTYSTIKENLMRLPDLGINYRLETTGKPTQFGNLEEILMLSKEIDFCKPCIDFAHIHARSNGSLKSPEDFFKIFDTIGNLLGDEALKDMHIHISGINYGLKGEKNHLPLSESDFNFKGFVQSLIKYDVKGCIISESPLLEKDALLLKSLYNSL